MLHPAAQAPEIFTFWTHLFSESAVLWCDFSPLILYNNPYLIRFKISSSPAIITLLSTLVFS